MERMIIAVVAVIVGLALGAAGGYYYFRHRSRLLIDGAEQRADRIVSQAEAEAKENLFQAREKAIKQADQAEREIKKRERELRG
jgi:uncharacterized protein HemX